MTLAITKIDLTVHNKLLCGLQAQLPWMSRLAADNSTFAIGGVSSPFDSFVVAESFVLRINTCGKKPAHRKSAKR